jgi:Flp pilus assembly pilin Flp
MASWIQRFWRDERGLEEVEIGIVAGLVVLVGALIFIAIGNDSETTLFSLEKATDAVANGAGS